MALAHCGQERTSDPRVFISYARSPDRPFVERLAAALRQAHFEPWVDLQSIPYGEDWRQEIILGIRQAVAVVFVLSPESIASKYCTEEFDLALTYGKKIIPLLRRHTEHIPAPVARIQRLEVLEESELDRKIPELLSALQTNQEWERLHNRFLSRALDYRAAPKDHRHELLLSQYELDEAERWRRSAMPRDVDRIVPAILQFLTESRKHVDRTNRILAVYTQFLSDEFKVGSRDWDDITREISELPQVQRTTVFSLVVNDAIRDGRGRLGDHFFYLLGNLPKALELRKSDWVTAIQSMLANEWFPDKVAFSMIANGDFTLPAFFAACDLTATAGQPTAPVSLPVRIASEALVGLRSDFVRENAWLFDKLLNHARSRAVAVTATIPVDAEIEGAQALSFEHNLDTHIDPDLFGEREQEMDSAFVLLNDVLRAFDLYHHMYDLLGKFSMKARLHLLGRLAVSFARYRHWGTAYRACECLWSSPLMEISSGEMLDWGSYYQAREYDLNVRDPQRQRYARRKCLEVLEIMTNNGAPLLWPAALLSGLGTKSRILRLLEQLRSEEGYPASERFDAFAGSLLEKALDGEILPFRFRFGFL